tara:strand:+ start:79 stop:306 length:228 start_codon:yes stop_codon:yes gene_type:complete
MSVLQYKIEKKTGYFYISQQTVASGSFVYLGEFGVANHNNIKIYSDYDSATLALSKFMEDDQIWIVAPAVKSKKK